MSAKFALIIANTDYTDPGLAKLSAPGKDAEGFARVLRDPNISAFDEVHILSNEPEYVVREAIDDFFNLKKPDDLLVLYFSGHGVRDELGSLYLAVKNTVRSKLRATGIKSDYIREAMDQSRSRRQVLILDCCNSGAFAQGAKAATGASVGTASAFEGGYGRVILTASDSTQYAWEGENVTGEAGTSVFTRFLIEGLEGNADLDGDGCITVDELYDYAYEQVKLATPRQTPSKFSTKQQGEIILRQITRIEDIKPVALPEQLTEEIENRYPEVRLRAVEQLGKILNGKNLGLARSAREALEKMLAEDDSRRVSQSAVQMLEAFHQVQKKAEEERKAKEEAERLAFLQAEEERLAREKAEADRRAKEEAERLARAQAAREAAEREARRLKAEREAAEKAAREAAEKAAREKAERELAEREAARMAAEREAARLATEREAALLAEREAARLVSEKKAAREAAEQAERDAMELAERRRVEREAKQGGFRTEKPKTADFPLRATGIAALAVLLVLSGWLAIRLNLFSSRLTPTTVPRVPTDAIAPGIATPVNPSGAGGIAGGQSQVELFSWWVGPGEADGLAAMVKIFMQQYPNDRFINGSVAGGAGTNAQTVLATRLSAGEPPDSWQVHVGEATFAYVDAGQIQPLDDFFQSSGFSMTLPPTLLPLISKAGHRYSVPLNIHRSNVLWYNPKVLSAAGVMMPSGGFASYEEFFAACDKIQAAGKTCLALGPAWTAEHLFENVMIGTLGADGWDGLWTGQTDWGGADVTRALSNYAKVLSYTNSDAATLPDWQPAAKLMSDGDAAFYIMGDWAHGYFANPAPNGLALKPHTDFDWTTPPGTNGLFVFLADGFVLPVGNKNPQGTMDWLSVVASKAGQEAFNPLKGSICARTDCDQSKFSEYSQKAARDWTSNRVVGSLTHEVVGNPAWNNEIRTALSVFLNDPTNISDFQTWLVAACQTFGACKQ